MNIKEKKFKKKMDAAKLAGLLRDIADQLEGSEKINNNALSEAFIDFNKASLKLKRKSDCLSVKVKVESQPQLDETSPTGTSPSAKAMARPKTDRAPKPSYTSDRMEKPKYKTLKKRMKSSFKLIREALESNQMPMAAILESFIRDSELMVTYPGYGDEFYEAYRNLCSRFSEACSKGDLGAVKSLAIELNQMKSDCHKRYK